MGRTTLAAAAATVLLVALGTLAGTAFAQAPTASDFEKVTLDDDTQNPMELDVADDGRVFYIERDGRLQIWKPDTQQTVTAGTIPVTLSQENGLLGLQLAPDFPTSHWVYLFYSQLPDNSETQVVSRFKVNGDTLDTSSEQRILTFQHQVAQCCHSSGSLYFAPDGSLYISVGDNTNPFDSSGFDPIDERPGREYWDAQRTAGNTNDLNGKILHIMPLEFPTGPPGVGSTYTIPANNLFDEAQDTNDKTRPEIFAMGLRNPFRFTVDPETGWVLMGDYGPDASATNPNRGPQGSVEFNVMTRAGNYGWPYCIRDNVPYNDYDFATSTSGPKFDCANPVNNSPNNTGLTNLPPAIGASGWMGYSETDPRLPGLGTGGAPMGGPRYHYDADLVSDRKFPAFYDDKWFIAEWNNGWIRTADLDASGAMTKVDPFALGTGYRRPMDLDFGPDGALYVIEWGSGFNGNNADSGVYRIDYKSGNQRPVAHATATPDAGLAPLQVNFSSAGSNDPEGTAITYAWDFDGDGTTDSTEANPSHTFTENGVHNVKLTVTDESGLTGVDNVQITVGNRPPQVTIEFPGDGQLASFTDTVPYRISVTDPEDGSTGAGISCDDVNVTIALGHDEHSHGLSQKTGCEGSFETGLTSGHGAEANTFTVLGVSYTDKGGPGGIAPLTGRAEAILQPKRKQAEFFSSTGRIAGAATGGDPGVQTETTSDTQGGGLNIGFIEDGDYVSYKPFDLKDISALRFRVASAGAGGTIEVRLDAPDGQLVAATDTITPTGDWQSFKDVTLPIPATAGKHELFLVFRNPGSTNSLMNVNWIDFIGKGAATTAAPDVSITATPSSGTAPLPVHFDATAVDPDAEAGDTLTYAWDFGVPGTSDDTSSLEDANYTYEQAGTYVATVTVTDGHGGRTTASTTVTVNPAGAACPTGFRDDFNGGDLAAPWEVIRRDQTLVVSGGTLTMPAQAGDIYQGTNTAKNIVVRPAPAGAWTAIAKINLKPLVQYQQAGLIVYGDDDNYTKLDRVATNSATGTNTQKFEFINETAGTARNTNQDYTANLPVATFPDDYYVRIVSDGTQITGSYSTDGENWTTVGRAANLPANPRIGLEALSNAAATSVDAKFDWFTLEGENVPVTGIGAGDTFTGGSLNTTRWNAIQREDPDHYEVSGGALRITTVAGDIYQTGDSSGTRNFMLQTADHAGADYVLETKLSSDADGGYQQGGILVYTDDDNYVKLDAISDANQTRLNRIELRSETAAAIGNPQPQVNVPAGTTDIWLRLTKLGTSYSGEYSFDGQTFTAMSAAVTHEQVAPRFGLFTIGANQPGKTFAFDYFKVDGDLGCEAEQTNADPVISSATADPSGGIAPLPVSFEAAATDADGDALTYGWDFDDDGTQDATGASASFTYTSAGTKTARLTVSDGKGGTATRAITISVLPADDPSARFRALVFSKTAGFRHSSIPDGIAAIRQLGADENFQVDATEDASLFRDDVLSHYDTVIWLSTTGDALSDAQQAAFERFIRAGGGYTGIHSAADTEYTWAWYGDLVGAYFRNHPNGTPTATVVVEDDDDPSTAGLPARWERTDEWYNYQSKVDPVVNGGGDDYSPRASGVHVLLTMDESTYAEADGSDDVDDDHPIAWCQRFDGGRSWYTGMGHTEASFSEPLFLSHILAGIEITAGVTPSADCGVTEEENHDPTVTAERTPAGNVRVGVPIAFTATGEDADGDTLTYAWDFGDGTTATEQNPTKTYTSAGTYTVTVTVSDGNGGTATATLPVTIQPNRNPSAGGLAASPQAGFAPLNVTFTGAASDPDGHEVSYAWDLDGDGTDDSTDQNPSYTYTETGTYTPRVRVTDAFGGSTTRTFVINVIPVERDPAAKYRVLVFSKTAAFRHSSIDEGIAAIKLLGEQNDFQVDAIEEPSLFTDEVLARYDAVIWLSTTGDVLDDAQQAAFERYIEHGGGYVGIHSAADTEYGWAWYGQLVGGYFRNHPNGTPAATVLVEDPTHPSTAHLPRPWPRVDEWYNYQSPVNPSVGGGGDDYSVRNSGVHVLLAMDESTYAEADGSDDIDDDHPISWCHRYDGGRAWYTGLGHTEASFTEPEFLQHVLGGIDVAAGAVADPACGVSEAGVPVVEGFADPLTGTAPLQVQFSSTAADPDGQALIYRWDFGDGGSALGSSPLHTYTKPGMYTATVTVRDPDGHTASATVRVTVDAPDNMV
ncbi:MAG TPA: ThuA domain-containing protein, partial [Candidatus Limnocylindrales bacterium]|nr:ThuA domain-containing protein [Candidatus Limnocylindrales bacterium]